MAKMKVSDLSTDERIERAKAKMGKLIDHSLTLLNVHEANRIILYSPSLVAQIPRSRAANAFNTFQHSYYQYEIVRLCAMWDKCKPDELEKESIPAVVSLIDSPAIIDRLERDRWSEFGDLDRRFADRQATRARMRLESRMRYAKRLASSSTMVALRNHRDKYIAHSLEKSWIEANTVVPPPRYGDERWSLGKTIQIMDTLYVGIAGTSFDWKGSIRIARRNAEALWHGCTFTVKT